MSDFSLRRVQIIYTLSLITAGIALLVAIIAYFLNVLDLIYFHFFTISIFLIASLIAKKGKLRAPRFIYFFTLNIAIVVTASYVGKYGGVEFMLMYALALPYMIFSFKSETHYMFSFSLLSILLWVMLYITDFNLITNSKLDILIAKDVVYPISIVTTLSLVTFQLFYFSYLNSIHSTTVHIKKDEAIDASNAKSQFLSTMSHEIRTPLNAVIGLSHILADNTPREDQKENINALNYSGKILLNLLNNVLDFSKMQSKEIELDNIPADLSLAVKQIKKIHEVNCIKKGISMHLEIDEDIPIVNLDIVRFNQVLNNLVSNAIKFTNKGSVHLIIKKKKESNGFVEIYTEVADTGIGIPEDKQKTIWEAFTQASNSTNRLYGGTGLGLPIVKSIITAMKSDVFIESEVGKGSKFYFTISLKTTSEKEIETISEKKEYKFKGKKILIVEDNLINSMVAKQILTKAGLKVSEVQDGLAAVKAVKKSNFDLVIMDIQMPIMDGYTATSEIRKFNKDIPVIALSASVFMEVKDRIEACGMDGFIFKPFNPDDLLFEIDKALEKNRNQN